MSKQVLSEQTKFRLRVLLWPSKTIFIFFSQRKTFSKSQTTKDHGKIIHRNSFCIFYMTDILNSMRNLRYDASEFIRYRTFISIWTFQMPDSFVTLYHWFLSFFLLPFCWACLFISNKLFVSAISFQNGLYLIKLREDLFLEWICYSAYTIQLIRYLFRTCLLKKNHEGKLHLRINFDQIYNKCPWLQIIYCIMLSLNNFDDYKKL